MKNATPVALHKQPSTYTTTEQSSEEHAARATLQHRIEIARAFKFESDDFTIEYCDYLSVQIESLD